MCIFSQPIAHVGATRIFTRLEGGEQLLAYEMSFAAAGTLAMVLPLPVPAGAAEDAVRFVDLSGYPLFFDDLERLFPEALTFSGGFGPQAQPASRAPLVVHEVGDFHASFVPTLADFSRLDRRLRVSDRVWRALPVYRDWGFAVFGLRGRPQGLLERLGLGAAPAPPAQKVHPMAMRFPTRQPSSLFFPTVHVHDGEVHARARFDHSLYCQAASAPRPQEGGFSRSQLRDNSFLGFDRAQGLLDRTQPFYRMQMAGEGTNHDVIAAA